MKQEFDSGSLFLKVCWRTKQGGHKQGGTNKEEQARRKFLPGISTMFFCRGLLWGPVHTSHSGNLDNFPICCGCFNCFIHLSTAVVLLLVLGMLFVRVFRNIGS